jgi:glutamine synthetase
VIQVETYVKVLNIEALTMVDMVNKDILPAISRYGSDLADAIIKKKQALPNLTCTYEAETLNLLSNLTDAVYNGVKALELAIKEAKTNTDSFALAKAFETDVLPKMKAIRAAVDHAECITGAEAWPYPTYAELLFGVR